MKLSDVRLQAACPCCKKPPSVSPITGCSAVGEGALWQPALFEENKQSQAGILRRQEILLSVNLRKFKKWAFRTHYFVIMGSGFYILQTQKLAHWIEL